MLGAVRVRAYKGLILVFFGPYADALIRVTVFTLDVSTSWCTVLQPISRSLPFLLVGSDGPDFIAHCHLTRIPLLRGVGQHTVRGERLVAGCQFMS